jgi:hypothetical protein
LPDSNELTPKELTKIDINNENFNNYFKVYIDKEREIFNNETIDKLNKNKGKGRRVLYWIN